MTQHRTNVRATIWPGNLLSRHPRIAEGLPQWARGGWLRFWRAIASVTPGFLLSALHGIEARVSYGTGRLI